jgi:hypothetical protein
VIAVGVGTGGSVNVSVGNGDLETTADGTAVLATTLTGGPATDDSTATGSGAGGDQSTMDSDAGVVAFGGGAPIPPAPPGALTGGGAGDGVPSVQPMVTANGRPNATTPKKTDLGESRTP